MTKFYDLLLNQVKELGDTIEKIKSSNSMHQISEYEVRVRKLCENIIISASMVPNKDIYSLSMQKRRDIQESVLSPVERVREILSQPEKPTEETPIEEETEETPVEEEIEEAPEVTENAKEEEEEKSEDSDEKEETEDDASTEEQTEESVPEDPSETKVSEDEKPTKKEEPKAKKPRKNKSAESSKKAKE